MPLHQEPPVSSQLREGLWQQWLCCASMGTWLQQALGTSPCPATNAGCVTLLIPIL